MDKKTIIFGSTGTLGKEMINLENFFICPEHSQADITNFNQLSSFIEKENACQILHLAALVGARGCEENKEKAYLTNVIGTKNLAKICSQRNIKLIYMSTDTVFDGDKGNYSEEDIPNPINYYSFTKFAGECFVEMVPSHLIIRASFFSPDNFPYKKVLTDQYTCRMPANDLAKEVLSAMEKNVEGTIHLGGEKDSLYNIIKKFKPEIGKMTIRETGLNLPKDLSLDVSKWRRIKNGA